MDKLKAIQEIENALNAAVAKGVFPNMDSAAYLFQCVQIIKQELQKDSENGVKPIGASSK